MDKKVYKLPAMQTEIFQKIFLELPMEVIHSKRMYSMKIERNVLLRIRSHLLKKPINERLHLDDETMLEMKILPEEILEMHEEELVDDEDTLHFLQKTQKIFRLRNIKKILSKKLRSFHEKKKTLLFPRLLKIR